MEVLTVSLSTIAAGYLILVGLAFGFYGLQGVFNPQAVATKLELQILGPGGRTGLRAVYGGFQLGLAALLIYFSFTLDGLKTGLVVAFVSEGALVIARGYGMFVDERFPSIHWIYLGLEILGLLTAVALLFLV